MMKRHCGCKNGWMMRSLIFVREILDITGISLRETGEPGKGARFEMTVPKGAFRLPTSYKNHEYGIAPSRTVT